MKLYPSEESDFQRLIDFFNSYHEDKRSMAKWKWEFGSHLINKHVYMVAEHDGKIVATQATIPIYINRKGYLELSGKSESTLVDKDYRGTSLFSDLYKSVFKDCKEKGIKLIWGFTTAEKAFKRIGFSIYSDIVAHHFLVLNLRQTIKETLTSKLSFKNKYVRLLSFVFLWLWRKCSSFFNKTQNKCVYSLKKKVSAPGDIQGLYKRLHEKFPNLIYLDMSDEYIQWRVDGNPYCSYRLYCLYEKNILRAYAFLNIQSKHIAHLSDFTSEDETTGQVLIDKIITDTKKAGFGILNYWANIKNELCLQSIGIIKKKGFIKKKDSMSIVIKNLDQSEMGFDCSELYITGLWTEGTSI